MKPQNKDSKKSFVVVHNKNNSIDSWKNLSISKIVPEKKLASEQCNEFLIQGEISKYIFDESIHKLSSNYALKFVIINRKEFVYYKSKETFLRMQSPSAALPLYLIKKVDRLPISSKEYSLNKQLHHLIIELIPDSEKKRLLESNLEELSRIHHKESSCSKSNQISGSVSYLNIFPDVCEENQVKCGNSKAFKLKRPNKMSLIKSVNIERNISILDMDEKGVIDSNLNYALTNGNSSKIYIFASKNEEIINKIVFLLNYLINKEK